MNPLGRCTFYIVHRADFRALAAVGAHILVYRELLVRHHPFVEVFADDVRIESGSGSFVEFLNTPFTVFDNRDDVQ